MPKGKKPKLTEEQREKNRQIKHEKFRELAGKRMEKLLKAGDSIKILATYPHEESESTDILDAVLKQYQEIDKAFAGKQEKITKFLFSQ